MKKLITLIFLVSAIRFCSAQDSASPSPQVVVGSQQPEIKNQKELIPLSAKVISPNSFQVVCDSLQTTLAGGNNHRGNMFDIVAVNEVTIVSFDGHPVANTDYAIYYKVGTFAGAENDSTMWTFVGSATGVVAQPLGTPTPLPIAVNIVIPAGQTYAWYVTSTDITVAQNYTNGTAQGNVFVSDANIQFLEGCGLEYPFSGAPFTPRVWNGIIHYCDMATGINENLLTATSEVFPNPVSGSGTINVHSSFPLKNAELKIFNAQGAEAMLVNNISTNKIVFDRNTLPAGMYFFVVKEENAVVTTGKLIFE